MDEHLRRRSAAWRDIEFNLDNMIYHIEARKADKWVDETDAQALSSIRNLLQGAICFARARYRDVLNAQVMEHMEAENEQVH